MYWASHWLFAQLLHLLPVSCVLVLRRFRSAGRLTMKGRLVVFVVLEALRSGLRGRLLTC